MDTNPTIIINDIAIVESEFDTIQSAFCEFNGTIFLAEWSTWDEKGISGYIYSFTEKGISSSKVIYRDYSKDFSVVSPRILFKVIQTNLNNLNDGYFSADGEYIRNWNLTASSWIDDNDTVFTRVLTGYSFSDLIQKCNHFPSRYKNHLYEGRFIGIVNDFLATQEVQEYLKNEAQKMTLFWVGMLGTSGNSIADVFYTMLTWQPQVNDDDITKFSRAMYEDILEFFAKGMIPKYSTDYGVDWELERLLKQNNLEHLGRKFPWKTSPRWEFNDAPSIIDYLKK